MRQMQAPYCRSCNRCASCYRIRARGYGCVTPVSVAHQHDELMLECEFIIGISIKIYSC
jgi:hypothetical protein